MAAFEKGPVSAIENQNRYVLFYISRINDFALFSIKWFALKYLRLFVLDTGRALLNAYQLGFVCI
jgi:hypothetical protein